MLSTGDDKVSVCQEECVSCTEQSEIEHENVKPLSLIATLLMIPKDFFTRSARK